MNTNVNPNTPVAMSIAPPLAPGRGWALMALSWLIPGAGFMAMGQVARGLVLFAFIEIPFVIGVAMTGAVLPPAWTPGDWGANIVNTLTFITQMGNGFAGGLWLVGDLLNNAFLGPDPPHYLQIVSFLFGNKFFMGDPPHALFELASFYIMVSGGLNYFCVCNFYDRLMAPRTGEKR